MAPGRKPIKKTHITTKLRDEIVSGALQPGARLPTRREVASRFNTTLVTAQSALAGLERECFVVSRGKHGTFVADHPPHLNRFALVFPTDPDENLFWSHLAAAARRVVKEQGLRLSIYSGIDKHLGGEDFERLLKDVRENQLAGLMFATNPFLAQGTDIVDRKGIPRVVMASKGKDAGERQVGHVSFDNQSFASKAVACLKQKGVAATAVLGQPGNERSRLLAELAKARIACPYHFIQGVTLPNRAWAKNVTRLLFDAGSTNRPDALIVLDDNLFDPALAGILDAGLSVPRDLEIITHSNFPWQVDCPVQITRLGYDMDQLLRLCLLELESQRKGNTPRVRKMPAVFESDLPQGRRSLPQPHMPPRKKAKQ